MSTVPAGEPGPGLRARPLAAIVLSTRPAFLTLTAVGVALGIASAAAGGVVPHASLALTTLLLALFAHAGINLLNDWSDAENGTDERNTTRLYPFTGGSRFIQNGVYTSGEIRRLALAFFVATIAGGLLLAFARGAGLIAIGAAGLAIGWAYSAPPLALNARGWGEPAVAAGMLCIVAGADFVQRGALHAAPLAAGMPFALLATNILFINQFPDREADLAAGKRHWVARLAPQVAARIYVAILIGAALALTAVIASGALPRAAAWSAIVLPAGAFAALELLRHARTPARLRPAIRATIATALGHGALLAAILMGA
ncbi:MAG: prenyltransferase [Gammaproteobacteria bacterium]